MDAEKERLKIEEASKELYIRQKELDSQLKDFEGQKESLNNIKKDLLEKQKEMKQLSSDYKAKAKLLQDVQKKIDELEGAKKMAELIDKLKSEVGGLKQELGNKGASLDELNKGKN
jgi:predicted  nucleic acid-binding Zn-ribbon protein